MLSTKQLPKGQKFEDTLFELERNFKFVSYIVFMLKQKKIFPSMRLPNLERYVVGKKVRHPQSEELEHHAVLLVITNSSATQKLSL
jgi:hypothetical protein